MSMVRDYAQMKMHVHKYAALSLVHTKNREAPGTHCLRMRLISPRYGDSGVFSDSSMLCDIRVRTRHSILVRILITMACNEKFGATDLLNFVRSIITISKLSTLHLESTHLRFSKPPLSFNVTNRALIVDCSQAIRLAQFLPKKKYCMEAISHRGSTKAAHRYHFR